MTKQNKAERKKARKTLQQENMDKVSFSNELEEIAKKASIDFKGQLPSLETAIGAMYVGQLYGWKVLRIIHGSNAYSKYEKILDVKFKNICPDRGPLAEKSVGIRIADAAGGFWKVATGKIPGRTPDADDEVDIPHTDD